ncbi:MAG: hypothetical protein JWM95_945 [Gemmatimonadetes bacterium]|nr:hypothetical protein [Gemmatimonadota bacterium]
MRLFHVVALSALSAVSAPAQAQCTWTAKDAWVKRQAEFFDDSKHEWSNDSLRTALLEAAGLSAPLAAPVQHGVFVEGRAPAINAPAMLDRLKQLASTRGSVWPTRSVVGGAGTHAVYLLVRGDTGLARAALHRMMEAGPSESPAADVATLEDQLRLAWGRKQIYGTQKPSGADGRVILAPMEDSVHADLRREDAGLPPFRLGLCMAAKAR